MYAQNKFFVTSNHDGLKLSCLSIVPENPRAVVLFVHGMNEYKERYLPLAQFLADHGFAVVLYDHRGHGKSIRTKDDLGYFYQNGVEGLVGDLGTVIAHTKAEFVSLPLFIFGHSMGTLVTRLYLKEHDDVPQGVILCGAPVKNPLALPGLILLRLMIFFQGDRKRSDFAYNMFSGMLNKKFEAEGKNSWLTRNREIVDTYNSDPLCSYIFTLNGYRTLMQMMRGANSQKGWKMRNASVPIRFIAGSDDPCITDEKAFCTMVQMFSSLGYSAVTSRIFEGSRHEIHNDFDREQVFSDIEKTLSGWLKLLNKMKKD